MKTTMRAALLLAVLACGCIVGDQLTTITIHPDGAADLILFRSNLHSTEQGPRAAKELADFQAAFDARKDGDFARIAAAGGEVVEAAWVHRETPLANLVRARLPDVSTLEKYLTLKSDDGGIEVVSKFRREGQLRRLTITLTVPPAKANPSHESPSDVAHWKQAQANGISQTRFAVTQGSITKAQGFNIAGDKQSALLDADAINDVFRTGGTAELYLEWQVTE